MNTSFKLAALAGAVSIAMVTMSSSALAAVAFEYDGWTVNGGAIDETAGGICAKTDLYTCSVVASGSGFKQVNVTEKAAASDGVSYIMTIVTDQSATGTAGGTGTIGTGTGDLAFADVSFVRMKLTLGGDSGNGTSGITARQKISDGAGTGKTFVSESDINTGWAAGTDANIKITQQLNDDGNLVDAVNFTGDDFSSGFIYSSKNHAETGNREGFEMSIDQVAGLASAQYDPVAGNPTRPHASAADVQVFALREKQGSFLTTSNTDSDRAANTSGIDLDTTDGSTPVTWTADTATYDATTGALLTGTVGDDVKAIWIGQEINLGTSTDLGNGSLGSSFGYVSFESKDAAGTVVSDNAFGFSETNSQSAWVWDDVFYVNETADPTITP